MTRYEEAWFALQDHPSSLVYLRDLKASHDAAADVLAEWLPILHGNLERLPRPPDGSVEKTVAWQTAIARVDRLRAALKAAEALR